MLMSTHFLLSLPLETKSTKSEQEYEEIVFIHAHGHDDVGRSGPGW